MNRKLLLAIIVIGGTALGVGAWSLVGGGSNDAAFPDGTLWMCTDSKCSTDFRMSMDDLSDFYKKHKGDPIPCPKCKNPAARASQCPACKHVFAQGGDHRLERGRSLVEIQLLQSGVRSKHVRDEVAMDPPHNEARKRQGSQRLIGHPRCEEAIEIFGCARSCHHVCTWRKLEQFG